MCSGISERGTLACWVEENVFWRRLRRCPERRSLGRLHRALEKERRSVVLSSLFFSPLLSALESIFSSSFLEASKLQI